MARTRKQAAVEEPAVTEPLPLEEEVTAVTPVEEVEVPAEPTVPEKPAKRPSPPPPPATPDPNDLVMVRVVGVREIVIGQTAYMRDETARVRYADYLTAAAAHPGALLVKLPGSQEYTK